MTNTTTLLIDADIVAYQFASKNQETFRWDEDTTSSHVTDLEEVKPQVDSLLASWKEKLKADEMIICLSCPHDENFRLGVLPTYKGNRDYNNRPALLGPIKDYMAEAYRTYARPTLEADDVMGILSTHPSLIPGKKIIVSEDKDMKTIPGWLFNPRKDSKPRLIDTEEADYWHLYQTLVGDATDHYKGCPGIGPVKAERLLKGPKESDTYWPSIIGMWMAATNKPRAEAEEDALVQARVARICRNTDYDFKSKEVRLWTPS